MKILETDVPSCWKLRTPTVALQAEGARQKPLQAVSLLQARIGVGRETVLGQGPKKRSTRN